MAKTAIKTLACSFGALLITAPLAFGAGAAKGSSATTSQSSSSTSQQRTGTTSETSGAMGQMTETMQATVASVDKSQGTVTIRPEQSQETVELKVPQQMLDDLQTGDSVEVSIRKAANSSTGMSNSPSSTSGTSGSNSPSTSGSSGSKR